MTFRWISLCSISAIGLVWLSVPARAQQPTQEPVQRSAPNQEQEAVSGPGQAADPKHALKPCAFSAINGDCVLILDRRTPVVPPTIFMRRGHQVTVVVSSPLPFERLSIGEKSAVVQIPTDQFASGFSDITTALGGLEIINAPAAGKNVVGKFYCKPDPNHPLTYGADITQCQVQYKTTLKNGLLLNLDDNSDTPQFGLNFASWVYSRLCYVRTLFIPLSPRSVNSQNTPPACPDLPKRFMASYRDGTLTTVEMTKTPTTTGALSHWVAGFSYANDQLNFPSDDLGKNIDQLDADIAEGKQNGWLDAAEIVDLKANQKALHAAFDTAGAYQAKMKDLLKAVGALPEAEVIQFPVDDLDPRSKNNELDTYDLYADNELTGIVGSIKADKYGDKIAALLGSLADAPAKQAVIEFKIDFVNQTHLEISTGLLIPFRQYHSFSLATPYSSATGTVGCAAGSSAAPAAPTNCPIVQQTLTFAVVPDVSFNIPFHEMVIGQQRAAWMFTIAPGYNSATTTATIGAGLSFAYRSLVFSVLPLADRDVKLTGGYQVNQSAGTASAPTTTNVWRVNPSIGISLRVPLSGGSN